MKLCENCYKEIKSKYGLYYCSKECWNLHRAEKYLITHKEKKKNKEKEYYKNPKICKYCGDVISFKGHKDAKFCSRKCSGLFNNGLRSSILGKPKTHPCLQCGCETEINKKYCSNKCYIAFNWVRTKNIIEQKKIIPGKGEGTSRVIAKKYLIEKKGNKCSICGISEWLEKPIMLIVDHIDGDCSNNKLDNFRLVCSNCDATLDTYKKKNKNCCRVWGSNNPTKYKD